MTTTAWLSRLARSSIKRLVPLLDREDRLRALRSCADACQREVTERVLGQGDVVRGGPFKGMLFGTKSNFSTLLPQLLGTYEGYLAPSLAKAAADNPPIIVNVGSADGYYAVGLALMVPGATVHAFDIEPDARRLTADLAERNGVAGRVAVGGLCDHAVLRSILRPGGFVVMDCEGCEFILLDPAAVPELTACSILVELHEFVHPDLAAILTTRFQGTHDIEEIRQTGVLPWDSGLATEYTELEQWAMVHELRSQAMRWYFMRPKATAST